jgi:hypothetical protein
LKQIGPMLPIGPRAGIIYSGLFKYTQQQQQVLQRTSLGPVPPNTDPVHVQQVEYNCTQNTKYYNSMSNLKGFMCKKRLKIAKGQSEAINQRTYNTLVKKDQKVQTMIYKPHHRKLKIDQHELN